MAAKCSTARRVTTSKVLAVRVSARAFCILTSVNVRARVTSRRKAAFLWLDSIRVTERCGDQSLMGRPGNPAPEPRSATESKAFTTEDTEDTEEGAGNRWRAAKKDSPKWRGAVVLGLRVGGGVAGGVPRTSVL